MFVLYLFERDYDYADVEIIATSDSKEKLEKLKAEKEKVKVDILEKVQERNQKENQRIQDIKDALMAFLDRNESAIKDTEAESRKNYYFDPVFGKEHTPIKAQGSAAGFATQPVELPSRKIEIDSDLKKKAALEWHTITGQPYTDKQKQEALERIKRKIVSQYILFAKESPNKDITMEGLFDLDKMSEPMFEFVNDPIPYIPDCDSSIFYGDFVIKEVDHV